MNVNFFFICCYDDFLASMKMHHNLISQKLLQIVKQDLIDENLDVFVYIIMDKA